MFVVFKVTAGTGKTCRQYHPNTPTELICQVEAKFRLTNESNGNQGFVNHDPYRFLVQLKVQVDQFTDRCPDSLLIPRSAMIKQVLERGLVPIGLKQDRLGLIGSRFIESHYHSFWSMVTILRTGCHY